MYQHFRLQITTIKTRPVSLLTLGIEGTHLLIASPCCGTSWVCILVFTHAYMHVV